MDYRLPLTNTPVSNSSQGWRKTNQARGWKLSGMPSTHAMLVDAHEWTSVHVTWGSCSCPSSNHGLLHAANAFKGGTGPGWSAHPDHPNAPAIGSQHMNGANMMFPDGSVERFDQARYHPLWRTGNYDTLVLDRGLMD
jgi:prepilin-type processing-associated H-X9-DG protein